MLLRQATLLESLLRVGLGLFWLNLPLLLGARCLGRLSGAQSGAARLCAQLTAGWVQILLSFQLLGTAGWLSFGSLGLLQWAILGLGLLLERRATRAAARRDASVSTSGLHPPSAPQAPDTRWMAPVLLALALSLGPWLRQTSLPPAMEDTLTYHLSLPAEWIGTGELRTSVQHDADLGPTYYPFAGEALLGWALLSTGTDSFATGSAWLCLPAMLAALLALASETGCGPRAAAAAFGLLATAPLVLWLTMVGFNDLPLACAGLLALHGGLRLRREASLGAAVEAGLGLGLLAAVKYSGLALGCGIALLGITAALRHGPRHLAALALAALLAGGYAYVRNWILTGSPLYPAHLEIFGQRLATGLYSASDWVLHPHHHFDWRRHLLTAEGIGRIGWPLVAGLLPLGVAGTLLAAVRKPPGGRLAVFSGLLGLAAFWMTSPYRHDPRFYVPAAALLAVPALALLERASRALGRAFEPLLVLGCGALFATSSFGSGHLGEVLAAVVLALAWRPRWPAPGATAGVALLLALAALVALRQPAYLEHRSQHWESIYEGNRGQVWKALDSISPPAGLTVAAAGTSNTYPLYGADLRNRVLFVPRNRNTQAFAYGFGYPFLSAFEDPTEAAWLQNLRKLGVQAFVLGPARCPERAWMAAHPEVLALHFKAGGYALYTVHQAP